MAHGTVAFVGSAAVEDKCPICDKISVFVLSSDSLFFSGNDLFFFFLSFYILFCFLFVLFLTNMFLLLGLIGPRQESI